MPLREIVLRHTDADALRADVEKNLSRGRAFVCGTFDADDREPCVLVVVHPSGGELRLGGDIVYVRTEEPGAGVGLQLAGPTADVAAKLQAFLAAAGNADATVPVTERSVERPPAPALAPLPSDFELDSDAPAAVLSQAGAELEPVVDEPVAELEPVVDEPVAELEPVVDEPVAELEPVVDEPVAELEPVVDEPAAELEPVVDELDPAPRNDADEADLDPDVEPTDERGRNLHERIRGLSTQEQLRVAKSGTMAERVLLERTYGPVVWEALLQNSRLTTPEVSRIAKKGTLPRPLLETIAQNGSWVGAPEVQRALLSNPRSGPTVVNRVLRMMSKPDLQKVPQQTAYPLAVRQAAKRLLS